MAMQSAYSTKGPVANHPPSRLPPAACPQPPAPSRLPPSSDSLPTRQPPAPVSDKTNKSRPSDAALETPPDADILKLEDTSDGSTATFGDSAKSSSPGRSKLDAGQDSKIGPLTTGPDVAAGEASTGGFETMLGGLVVAGGLVTPDELEMCKSMQRQSSTTDDPRTLADLLLEKDLLTQRQLQRIRSEFEARKSSQRIPGYRIRSKLGAGAMATVFLADQLSLGRPVAVKVLPKKFSSNAKFIERFYKEGRAAAQLNHPNIVAAYDVGQAGDHHYFVMEYIDGPTIYDKLVKDKRISEADAIRIVTGVAKALQHAHARGFIHRDIKPKNIMLNSQGVVKLADLGLARAMTDKEAAKAEAGRAYGTPYYISPEQIRGEVKIGPPADIYGLGATFYHMVTGRVPYEGKNPSAVMHQHLKSQLIPPDHVNPKISAGTAQVIEMMMAKDPTERYQNATDLLHDLELIAQGQPPHFARKHVDLTEVATSIASDVMSLPPVVQQRPPRNGQRATESPVFMIVMVMLGLSMLANIILAILLVAMR
jgi:tRNA A-37 threonylcarbamoyl transferase component Bud32